jgi:hypothetical protein
MRSTAVVSWPCVSCTVYVEATGPEKPAAGVYPYEPSAAIARVPDAGAVKLVTVRLVPRSSASTPDAASRDTVTPAEVVSASSTASGVTVIVSVAVVVCAEESRTV